MKASITQCVPQRLPLVDKLFTKTQNAVWLPAASAERKWMKMVWTSSVTSGLLQPPPAALPHRETVNQNQPTFTPMDNSEFLIGLANTSPSMQTKAEDADCHSGRPWVSKLTTWPSRCEVTAPSIHHLYIHYHYDIMIQRFHVKILTVNNDLKTHIQKYPVFKNWPTYPQHTGPQLATVAGSRVTWHWRLSMWHELFCLTKDAFTQTSVMINLKRYSSGLWPMDEIWRRYQLLLQ